MSILANSEESEDQEVMRGIRQHFIMTYTVCDHNIYLQSKK